MAQVKKASQQVNSPDGPGLAPTHCCAESCKANHTRFGFCDTHFEEFKFGLIKKNGMKVPDYDKKFDHYQNYLRSRNALPVKKAA